MTELADLMVASLGESRYDSPLADFVADRRTNEHYVDEDDRVIFPDTVWQLSALATDPRVAAQFRAGRAEASAVLPARIDPGRRGHLRWAVSRA